MNFAALQTERFTFDLDRRRADRPGEIYTSRPDGRFTDAHRALLDAPGRCEPEAC